MDDLFWLSLAGLIAVAGPWKAAIAFAELTRPMPSSARQLTALYTVAIASVVGLVFLLVGEPLIEFFKIDDGAFLIAAGLIVIVFSLRTVTDQGHVSETDVGEDGGAARALSLAAYPLAVPKVITPPGIATLIALGVIANIDDTSLVQVAAAFLLAMGLNLGVFLFESAFADRVSLVFYQVAGRLLAVLLVAVGVTVAVDGLTELAVLPK